MKKVQTSLVGLRAADNFSFTFLPIYLSRRVCSIA